MARLVDHQFVAGQRWQNQDYVLYICCVNDDYPDGEGNMQPGQVVVTADKPFPGRSFKSTWLSPASMQNVVDKGGYKLLDDGWHPEFNAQKKAMDDARAASGETDEQVKKPKLHGLGAMMQG